MSIAATSLYPPGSDYDETWVLKPLDPLLNAAQETADWALKNIPAQR